MKTKIAWIIIAGICVSGILTAQAVSKDRKQDRKRDGTGDKCQVTATQNALASDMLTTLAASKIRKYDRKRDGTGDNCTILGSQSRRGGGKGDRKRDGTGDNCLVTAAQTAVESAVLAAGGNGKCQRLRKRDGTGENCTVPKV